MTVQIVFNGQSARSVPAGLGSKLLGVRIEDIFALEIRWRIAWRWWSGRNDLAHLAVLSDVLAVKAARRPRVERIGWGGAGRALAAGWRSGAQGCFTWVLNLNQIKCLFPGSPAGRVSVPGRMGPEAASSAPPPLAGGVPEAGPETAGGDPSSTGVWDTDRACSWPLAAGPLASVPPRPLTLVLTPAGPRLSSFTSPGLLLRVTGASAFPV